MPHPGVFVVIVDRATLVKTLRGVRAESTVVTAELDGIVFGDAPHHALGSIPCLQAPARRHEPTGRHGWAGSAVVTAEGSPSVRHPGR